MQHVRLHVRLAELLGALSHALDMTEGQPAGHCVRCCWIGIHIGREIGLSDEQLWELYYVLLLKDLGCSSNAARICQLYLTDDLAFKHDFKHVDGSPELVPDDSFPKGIHYQAAAFRISASIV